MELADFIGRIAAHEATDDAPEVNASAVKRGEARAASLSAKRREEIARKAAATRWNKRRPK